MSRIFCYAAYRGFKIHNFSQYFCIDGISWLFPDTYRPFRPRPTLQLLLAFTAHCHSALHAHVHLGWPHSVTVKNAAMSLATGRWRYFYSFYILLLLLKTYHTMTVRHKGIRKAELWMTCESKFLYCTFRARTRTCRDVCAVSVANCRVFPGKLISVAVTLVPAGQVWQTSTVFRCPPPQGSATRVVPLFTAALKLHQVWSETIVLYNV